MSLKNMFTTAKTKLTALSIYLNGKTAIAASTASSVALSLAQVAYAAPTDNLTSGIKSGMKELYAVETAIAIPIAAVCLGYTAFQFFLGGERGVEKAKKMLLYLAIGLALVYLAPLAVVTIAGWFENNGDGGAFS